MLLCYLSDIKEIIMDEKLLIMEKKILLFNYFLKSLAQFEQRLMGFDDFNVAMLATITSKATVYRRYPSGCTMESVAACIPSYAQELFIYALIDAKKNGDGELLKSYDFKPVVSLSLVGIEDYDVTDYLKKLFPMDSNPDLNVISCILGGKYSHSEIRGMFKYDANYSRFNEELFEVASECEETAMIDRTMERLVNNAEFVKLLNVFYKHDHYCRGLAYQAYTPYLHYLESK